MVLEGVPVHVTQRGNRRQDVFFESTDRLIYLRKLREHSSRHGLDILGYCLMTNHVHLLAIPQSLDSLAKTLARTHYEYARWVNLQRGWAGHVWQNHYFSCPLDGTHLWEALRYVERNPVRAGLVEHASEWRWSSAAAHLGRGDSTGLLDLTLWRQHYSPAQWNEVLESGLAAEALAARIREATATGRPLGSLQFVERLERKLGRPLAPRKPGPKPGIAFNDIQQASLWAAANSAIE